MPSLIKVLLALSLASTDAWFQKTFCSYWEERDGKCICQDLPGAIQNSNDPDLWANLDDVGDSTKGLVTNTQWLVQPEQILTYPCSTGYLGNAAANYELEHDIQDAITDLGHDLIEAVKCGVKCDINNGQVKSGALHPDIYESNNANSILEANRWGWPIYNHEEIEYLCGAHPGVGSETERTGALDKWWIDKRAVALAASDNESDGGFGELVDGLSACDCKTSVTFGAGGPTTTGSIASGCYRCSGTITYGITPSTGCYVSDSDIGH